MPKPPLVNASRTREAVTTVKYSTSDHQALENLALSRKQHPHDSVPEAEGKHQGMGQAAMPEYVVVVDAERKTDDVGIWEQTTEYREPPEAPRHWLWTVDFAQRHGDHGM